LGEGHLFECPPLLDGSGWLSGMPTFHSLSA
jgi:hypothetical protein